MKTLQYFITFLFFFCYTSYAQTSVTVNTPIPAWGVPVTTERYYYIPDIETYYDTSSREYIYLRDGIWVRSAEVPAIYRNYDFHRGRKIVINDYRGNAPYAFYNIHRVKYVPSYRSQKALVKPQTYRARGNGNSNANSRTRSRR